MGTNELRKLKKQEEIIAGCMEDFVRLGLAYKAIREERLYKAEGYKDFALYCRDRWNTSRRHVDQLIGSAALRLALPESKSEIDSISNWNEFNVRALKRLGSTSKAKAVAVRVIKEVKATGAKLSATLVSKHVREAIGPTPKAPRPDFPLVVFRWTDDISGIAATIEKVPDDALELFARTHPGKAKALAAAIERLEKSLTRVWETLP